MHVRVVKEGRKEKWREWKGKEEGKGTEGEVRKVQWWCVWCFDVPWRAV